MQHYMRFLGLMAVGLIAMNAPVWGQTSNTAPVITSDSSESGVRVGQTVSVAVVATDAEQTGAGALTFSFAEVSAFGITGLTTQKSGTSGEGVSNDFTVPLSASGQVIELGVTVSDGAGGEASQILRYRVDGVPVIGAPSFSRAVEMTEGSFSVAVTDPEGSELSVQLSVLGASPLPPLSRTSFTGVSSGSSVSTGVKYVEGTYGKAYTFRVDVTDKAGSTATREFRETVSTRNLAPTVTLNLQQGGNTSGTSSSPVKPGGVRVWVDVQDPEEAGYFPVIWEANRVQGSFCSSSMQFFGAEDWDASLIIPLVSTSSTVRVKATVGDGLHSIVKTRDIVVEPEPGGCDPASGGGTTFPSVSASISPTRPAVNQTISLSGSIDRPTSGYSPTWYLLPSTSGSNPVLLAKAWTTTYRAPAYPTTLKFRFIVSDSSQSVTRDLSATVVASGGSGGNQVGCTTCSTGSPPIVDAGPASIEVIGGQAATLSGAASDPNLPPTTIPSFTVLWEIVDPPSSQFRLESPSQFQTRLLTPVVQEDVTITLRLTVTSGSNSCSCSDMIQVLVRAQSALEPSAQIQYAFPGSTLTLGTENGTVMKDVSSWPVTINLQGTSSHFTSPIYHWTTGLAGAVFSAPGTASTTLTVPAPAASTTVNLKATLTVSEGSDSSVKVESNLNFEIVGPEVATPPESVSFSVQPGLEAEVGTMVILDGSAVSGVDGASDGLSYEWRVRRNDGYDVPVMKYSNRGIFFVPDGFGANSKLSIQLVVSQGSAAAPPVEKTLDITLPTLRFAHFGVGLIPATAEELKVELVLINDSSTPLEGATLRFRDASGAPVKLEVNGDYAAVSQKTFDLEAGAAGRFLLASPDGEVYSGWMEVTSPVKLTGLVLFKYLDTGTGKVRTETALYSSPGGRRFTMALGPGRNSDVGLAIANPGRELVRFRVKVVENQSIDSIEKELELEPGAQVAKFLPSLFGLFPIPEEFSGGTLIIEVDGSADADLVASVLRLREGYISTVPLAVRND